MLNPRSLASICGYFLIALLAAAAHGQALPRIAALYPPGARAGQTVEVAIRGSGLEGARAVVVDGSGLSVALNATDVKINPEDQKVFTAKCALCHELRGPASISRTADQWVATVDRMIRDRAAPIEAADRAKIVAYLQAAARASAGLTARIVVAPNAQPGRRELRVVGANGTSTAYPFEVTTQPEALETEPNDTVPQAAAVSLPLTVSGQLAARDVDSFAFQAKQGERLVFNCNAYRMNQASQAFFFPVLVLFDDKGKELARNSGYFSLDPLLDWTAPADGKYVVQIRDMLYRGTPGSVYRLSMGSFPYGTYLYPPGGRRGEKTAVTIAGNNLEPLKLDLTLPADAGEVREMDTPVGRLPFIAGDYPEYLEQPADGAQRVELPVSLNGRLEAADETDRYTFTLTQESLGAYSFTTYADRVGSPLVARLTLRDGRGRSLATVVGQPAARDPRLDFTFREPGDYTLEVADAGSKSGPAYVYRVSAGRAAPDFRLIVGPDNPNLGPGSSVYLGVRVERRTGIPGEIELRAEGLPAGVTASPTRIRPGENQAFLILTAAPDAQPGAYSTVRVVGRAVVDNKPVEREAAVSEIFRINNNAQIAYRSNMVVSVGPPPVWTLSLEPSGTQLSPESGPITITARLNRKGAEGDIPFAIQGIPQGVQGPRSLLFKRGTGEMTFTLTPTNGGIFAARGQNAPSSFLLTVVNGREGEAMMMCSAPLSISVAPASQK